MKKYSAALIFTIVIHILVLGYYFNLSKSDQSLNPITHFGTVDNLIIKIKMISLSTPTKKSVSHYSKPGEREIEEDHKKHSHEFNNFSKEKIDSGQKTLLSSYLTKVRNVIERNKSYPPKARRLKQEGTVKVKFSLDEYGHLLKIYYIEAPFESLKDSILNLLEKRDIFPAFPEGLKEKTVNIEIGIVFKLS